MLHCEKLIGAGRDNCTKQYVTIPYKRIVPPYKIQKLVETKAQLLCPACAGIHCLSVFHLDDADCFDDCDDIVVLAITIMTSLEGWGEAVLYDHLQSLQLTTFQQWNHFYH